MADDRLKFSFGDLNPVEIPESGRSLDVRNTSVLGAMRESALSIFKKDAFQNTGPLKGVVLRVDKEGSDTDASSWVKSIFGDERSVLLISVKVRIPEIHAVLPEPLEYGLNSNESHRIIDMYPSFVAIDKETSDKPVAPGDIVIVDFVDRINLKQPIYLGPVVNFPNPGAVGKNAGSDSFDNKTTGGLGVTQPVGDEIGGIKDPNNQIPKTTVTSMSNVEQNNMIAQTIGETTDSVLGGDLPKMFHELTVEEIQKIMPQAKLSNIQKYLLPLNQAMAKYQINTPQRQAVFLAQVAVESGQLRFDIEQASDKPHTGGNPVGSAYEGRASLGNTQPGDGPKFIGRGLIQLTGRYNYTSMTKKLQALGINVNLVDNPDIARRPDISALIAAQFFQDHKLNQYADNNDIVGASRVVNGGDLGLASRINFYNKALSILV